MLMFNNLYANHMGFFNLGKESSDKKQNLMQPIHKLFLMQVSQYTFAMCSYREKKSEPQELMQLEGYTVDYTDPHPGNSKSSHFPCHSCIYEILINILCLFYISNCTQ